MAILKVARMGHPILRQKARLLKTNEIQTPEIQRLIDDMIETMREYDGVGLAAPQVHQSLQIAVMEIPEENPRYAEANIESVPVTIFINPEITALTKDTEEFWEGCLSVPGMRGLVKRPRAIKLKAIDRYGKKIETEYEGFSAIAIQHETDHLFGILYVDKLVSTKDFAFSEEYTKYRLAENDREV